MRVPSVTGFSRRLTRRRRAAEALSAALAGRRGYEDLKIVEILKPVEGREIAVARVGGARVVLKRFSGDMAAETVRKLKAELDTLADRLNDGPNRVMACRAIEPDLGIAVLSLVPGRRFSEALARASGGRRAALMTRAGEWLDAASGFRTRDTSFGPGFWVARAHARPTDPLMNEDRALLGRLLARLRTKAQATGGSPVRQAATHGDYVPINLMIDGDTLWGIDIQGESWLAISRDAARFLVWTALHAPRPGPTRFGLPAGDVEAFLASGLLPDGEERTTLPFFIGEQLHSRLCESGLDPAARQAARKVIAAYLADTAVAG